MEDGLLCPITGRIVALRKSYRHECPGCPVLQHRRDLVTFVSPSTTVECCGRLIGATAKTSLAKGVYEHVRQAAAHQSLTKGEREAQVSA